MLIPSSTYGIWGIGEVKPVICQVKHTRELILTDKQRIFIHIALCWSLFLTKFEWGLCVVVIIYLQGGSPIVCYGSIAYQVNPILLWIDLTNLVYLLHKIIKIAWFYDKGTSEKNHLIHHCSRKRLQLTSSINNSWLVHSRRICCLIAKNISIHSNYTQKRGDSLKPYVKTDNS